MLDLIHDCVVKLWVTQKQQELQNGKLLPTVGFEPTTSRLLVWRYDQLYNDGTTVVVNIFIRA